MKEKVRYRLNSHLRQQGWKFYVVLRHIKKIGVVDDGTITFDVVERTPIKVIGWFTRNTKVGKF